MLHEATLYKPLKKGYVQCTACEHFCAIEPEGMGKCGIRRNYDGALYLVVYGEAAALHVDPIEKKPLFHFLPTQPVLSLGTVGCNFTCQFCQNWEISQSGASAVAGQTFEVAENLEGRMQRPASHAGRPGGALPPARHPHAGLHLQRADRLLRVRLRHGPAGPPARHPQRLRQQRLRVAGRAGHDRALPGRDQRRPQSVERHVLSPGVRHALAAGAAQHRAHRHHRPRSGSRSPPC